MDLLRNFKPSETSEDWRCDTLNGSVSALQKACSDMDVMCVGQWAEQATECGLKKEFPPDLIGWSLEGGCCSVAQGSMTEVWLLASL